MTGRACVCSRGDWTGGRGVDTRRRSLFTAGKEIGVRGCRDQHCRRLVLPNLPELQIRTDYSGTGASVSAAPVCVCVCQWVEATPLSVRNASPPSQRSARCPLTDTNTNIIPTRGGNSFLTWMIKIFFLKSMLMASSGRGSKQNYWSCCKCFLLLYLQQSVIEL